MTLTLRRVLVLATLAAVGCTDAAIQPNDRDPRDEIDNLLEVRGEFCTMPDSDVVFPVKVLFIIDQSTSLQCTDSTNRRFVALQQLLDQLLSSPSTEVGFVGFSAWARTLAFTRDRGAMATFLDPAGGLGPATDYQGALAQAVRLVEDDMVDSGPAERARTRYVVVFVSDGVPEPRCNAGCEDDQQNCSDGVDDDGDGAIDGADADCADITDNSLHPDNLYGVCNTLEEIPDDSYVDIQGLCPAYNQAPQIMQRVQDLLALRDTYSAGAITLHTVLMFSPQSVVDAICPGSSASFGYNHDQARALLLAMSQAGNGAFRDANLVTADEDFLQFDFRQLEAPQVMSALQASDRHAVLAPVGHASDLDGDLVSDEDEVAIGLDPKSRDSDLGGGDGYGDLFELRLAGLGFDALDPTTPAVPCNDTTDLDGDGLVGCEEAYLGTDPRSPDSDGDGILDRLELAAGTDWNRADALEDLDFDGVLNGDEIAGGTDPAVADADRYVNERVHYHVEDLGRQTVTNWQTRNDELRQCYRFDVRDLRMIVTPVVGEQGLNRIMIYAFEKPAQLASARATVSVACFEAFYRSEFSKDPADGVIDVTSDVYLQVLGRVQGEIDGLAACGWFDPAGVTRGDIEDVIDQCLPDRIVIGNYELPEDRVQDLVRHYVASGGEVSLPRPPSELFVPIEIFDPSTDCYRPWELDRLSQLFQVILDTCNACGSPSTDADAGAPSPCCDRLAP